jgi:hypothetical protein
MKSRRNKSLRCARTLKKRNSRRRYGGKKWTTAIEAAQHTLSKTGSIDKARSSLRKQALINARKLFGSVTA